MGGAEGQQPEWPSEAAFEPLLIALGNLLLASALLEKTLLTDLVARRVIAEGFEATLGRKLVSRLERRTAGPLLEDLRELGYQPELAAEVASAIDGRNRFVHRILEDPGFIVLVSTGAGAEALVARVEAVVTQIQAAISKLAPTVRAEIATAFGRSPVELAALLKTIEPEEIGDQELREQLVALQALPEELLAGLAEGFRGGDGAEAEED